MASKSMSESKSLCSSSMGGSGQLSTSLSSSRCCMPACSVQCSGVWRVRMLSIHARLREPAESKGLRRPSSLA